jgi:hypothetical protein
MLIILIILTMLVTWKFIRSSSDVYIVTGPTTTTKTYDRQVILDCLNEMD